MWVNYKPVDVEIDDDNTGISIFHAAKTALKCDDQIH